MIDIEVYFSIRFPTLNSRFFVSSSSSKLLIVYYRPGPFSISSGINPRKIDDDELKSVRAKRERAVFPKVFITQPGMVMMLPCHVSRVRRVAVVI